MRHYHELFPKTIETGKEATFTIRSRYEPSVLKQGASVVVCIRNKRDCMVGRDIALAVDGEGAVSFTYKPEVAGEFILRVNPPGVPWNDQNAFYVESAFFAVKPEMMKLRPYKGDFHIHTAYDGKFGESPVFLAARCRELGLDYAAITEHRHYAASLEAIAKASKRDFDILLFPGEEINYMLGRMWTICFSESLERQSILRAISECRAVGCYNSGDGNVLVFGPFDLMEFAYFLIREFFPVRDDYCRTLGKLYRHELENGIINGEAKDEIRRHIEMLYAKYWSC